MNPLGAPSNNKYGFTDAERKYLSMKQIAEKKDHKLVWVLALLILAFLVYWFVDRPLKVEAQITESSIKESDLKIYEEWEGQTREICQRYLTK